MTKRSVDRFVSEFVEAWARPDSDGFRRLWLPEGVFMHPTVRLPLRGADVPAWSERIKAAMPDLAFHAEHWASRDDLVFLQWTCEAKIAGRHTRWSGVDRFRIREGRIAEEVVYFDTLEVWAALDPAMHRPPLVDMAASSAG